MAEGFDEPLEVVWNGIMQSWQEMWDKEEDREKLVEDLFGQIRAAAEYKVGMDTALLVLGNIWLLERYGYIEADEYNGMQFASLDGFYTAVPRRD